MKQPVHFRLIKKQMMYLLIIILPQICLVHFQQVLTSNLNLHFTHIFQSFLFSNPFLLSFSIRILFTFQPFTFFLTHSMFLPLPSNKMASKYGATLQLLVSVILVHKIDTNGSLSFTGGRNSDRDCAIIHEHLSVSLCIVRSHDHKTHHSMLCTLLPHHTHTLQHFPPPLEHGQSNFFLAASHFRMLMYSCVCHNYQRSRHTYSASFHYTYASSIHEVLLSLTHFLSTTRI